jgi:hypothetical protein
VFLLAACSGGHSAPATGSAASPPPPQDVPAGAVVVDAAPAPALAVDAAPVVDAPLAAIMDWPIAWPPERDAAMLAYRRLHNDPAAKDTTIEPHMIVLHYTAGGSAEGTKRYFDNLHMEKSRATLAAGGDVNVSAHFLVDRDGTIFRLVPETRMARHAIGVNHIAIGVENVGDEDRWKLTDAQIEADAALIRDLAARFPIELVAGHHEVRSLEGTPWFVERDPKYRNRKPDPGDRFMRAVRAKIADLGLKSPADVIGHE